MHNLIDKKEVFGLSTSFYGEKKAINKLGERTTRDDQENNTPYNPRSSCWRIFTRLFL